MVALCWGDLFSPTRDGGRKSLAASVEIILGDFSDFIDPENGLVLPVLERTSDFYNIFQVSNVDLSMLLGVPMVAVCNILLSRNGQNGLFQASCIHL